MATYSDQRETRLIFVLTRDEETTTRTISIPGAIAEEDTQTAVLNAFKSFRTGVLTERTQDSVYNPDLRQFVQPSNWRDDTGSSEVDSDPWTTTDIELEFYKVTKERYTAEDLNP